MDADGDFVVTWTSYHDGNESGVFAQRYNAAGVAQGSEFQVNSFTLGKQSSSSIAIDADGDFVITWHSQGQDGSGYGIYAQRYNAAGVAQDGEFRVNTATTGDQRYAAVAMDEVGNFVVTWTSYGQDGSVAGVYAQRYDSTGATLGTEFRVNTATADFQGHSQIAMDTDGDFVIAWTSSLQDGSFYGIYAQRYNAAGEVQGGEFRVNSYTTYNQWGATIDMDSDGDFVIAWQSYGQDGSHYGVYAQRFNDAGMAQGGEFKVNSTTENRQRHPRVAMDTAGDFVVTWVSLDQDGSAYGIYAQRYNAAGATVGSEIQVNITTEDEQRLPGLAMDAAGNFVVVWSSHGQDNDDETFGVYARQYQFTDAPVVSGPASVSFLENSPALPINVGLTVADTNSTQLASARVTMTNFVAGQDVLGFSNDGATMGNIAIVTNASGILTLVSAGSSATLAEWQAALRAVTYENTSDNPSTTPRTIEFVVNDGLDDSNTFTRTVTIVATNDPPILKNIETATLSYAPNSAAITVSTLLSLADPDSTTMTGATIRIANGYQVGDVLSFTDTPNITGVFNAGILTLTGTDTTANYEAALRSVTYISASQNAALRTISYRVQDGTDMGNVQTRAVGGYAQRSGDTINVYGSPQVDAVTITDSGILGIVVNGEVTQFDSHEATAIDVFTYGGDDTIQIDSLVSGRRLRVFAGEGNDSVRIHGSVSTSVTLNGGGGNDILVAGSGSDILLGGLGHDWLDGGNGNDALVGGSGNDVYVFNDSAANQVDTVAEQANEGTDTLNFTALTTTVSVSLTSDMTMATMARRIVKVHQVGQSANFENVQGGSASDFIAGNSAGNSLFGNGGNDTLSGGQGNDFLNGGAGNDLLKGGSQNDVLSGGLNDDILNGESGDDQLIGGEGSDSLAGDVGDDVYAFGQATINQIDTVVELVGAGTDTLSFSTLTTPVTVNLTQDTALATMAKRIVRVKSSGQSGNFENVIGGSGNDQITGNSARNLLSGLGGNDTITANEGSDIVLGGDGNDTLQGVGGRNILIGGSGGDLLNGGTGGDLLLAGATIFETDWSVLQTLLGEWSSLNSYQLRLDHLLGITGGGANATFTLNSSTVASDLDIDYVTGNAGQDWFLADSSQEGLTDIAADEVFTQIDTWN